MNTPTNQLRRLKIRVDLMHLAKLNTTDGSGPDAAADPKAAKAPKAPTTPSEDDTKELKERIRVAMSQSESASPSFDDSAHTIRPFVSSPTSARLVKPPLDTPGAKEKNLDKYKQMAADLHKRPCTESQFDAHHL